MIKTTEPIKARPVNTDQDAINFTSLERRVSKLENADLAFNQKEYDNAKPKPHVFSRLVTKLRRDGTFEYIFYTTDNQIHTYVCKESAKDSNSKPEELDVETRLPASNSNIEIGPYDTSEEIMIRYLTNDVKSLKSKLTILENRNRELELRTAANESKIESSNQMHKNRYNENVAIKSKCDDLVSGNKILDTYQQSHTKSIKAIQESIKILTESVSKLSNDLETLKTYVFQDREDSHV